METGVSGPSQVIVMGVCVHSSSSNSSSIDLSGCKSGWEFIGYLSDCYLLK